jgi:hypothetical protein
MRYVTRSARLARNTNTAEWVEAEPLLHHRARLSISFAEVDRPGRDEHLQPSARQDHATDFTARLACAGTATARPLRNHGRAR